MTTPGEQLDIFGAGGGVRSTLRPDLPPGAPQAKRAGCQCSVAANDGGLGIIHPGEAFDHTVWAVSSRCKLHWPQGI